MRATSPTRCPRAGRRSDRGRTAMSMSAAKAVRSHRASTTPTDAMTLTPRADPTWKSSPTPITTITAVPAPRRGAEMCSVGAVLMPGLRRGVGADVCLS